MKKNVRLELPADVYNIVLAAQAKQKIKCNCQYSIQSTIIKIIREYEKSASLVHDRA